MCIYTNIYTYIYMCVYISSLYTQILIGKRNGVLKLLVLICFSLQDITIFEVL